MMRPATFALPMVFTLACGSASSTEPPKAPEQPTEAAVSDGDEAAEPEEAEATDESAVESATRGRVVGDYFVYRYSGKFTSEPITLTEQVVAEEFGLVVVDFVLEQGEQMEALRVRMKPAGGIVSVARLGSDGEEPATLAAYSKMMEKTQLVPEANEEVIGTEEATCLVGEDEELDCATTSYVVRIGGRHAVLSVTKSEDLPGRDVGGEILAADGGLMYRAQLVERGNEKPGADAVAWAGKSLRFTPPSP